MCLPLRAGLIWTKNKAGLVCFISWLLSILLTSPMLALAEYRAASVLAELNNEGDAKQPLYAERLRNLRTFVLAGSSVDGVIVPPESQMFGFDACDATVGAEWRAAAASSSERSAEPW